MADNQPNLTPFKTMTPDVTVKDTGDTDPITGLPILTGSSRLAVDLRAAGSILDWQN